MGGCDIASAYSLEARIFKFFRLFSFVAYLPLGIEKKQNSSSDDKDVDAIPGMLS